MYGRSQAKMLQMTLIWSSDKTVDSGYGLRYHPSQGLLLKQQLDCMMNPLQSMLVNCGIYYLKKSLLSNSLNNSRYFLISSYTSTRSTANKRIHSLKQKQSDRLESPVRWPATSSVAVLIPTSSYKSVKKV